MYANLRVEVDGVEHSAHRLEMRHGKIIVHLDDDDDSGGTQPVDAGTIDVSNAQEVTITACF